MSIEPSVRLPALWRWDLVAAVGILGLLLVGLVVLLPANLFVMVVAITSMLLVFYVTSVLAVSYQDRLPDWTASIPIWAAFFVPFTVTIVLLTQLHIYFDTMSLLLIFALILVFFYYWLIVPLALYQRLGEQAVDIEVETWPELTVIIPAYNEAGYVGSTIESFLEADYPREKLAIAVVDDGSSDSTYREALEYEPEGVQVFRKDNGGKHSALNYGLARTGGDIVVTVDSDSCIARDALRELVRSFHANPDAAGIAGNVKVGNRGSHVTNLQALEYIIGINTFRRVFDLLGVVTVVPGCLGLFRRGALETVGLYSGDTITEDFDLTIELLERGYEIHHSNAVVLTEVPDTWTDLYKQRIRWFRGNIQTVLKHRRIFVNTKFGNLHRVAAPYLLFTMSVFPALGVLILGLAIWIAVSGGMAGLIHLVGSLLLFVLLQFLLSVLAIYIEEDNPRLALYAPFSIIGYKQFLDGALLKSIVDVSFGRELQWTRPARIRQRVLSEEDS